MLDNEFIKENHSCQDMLKQTLAVKENKVEYFSALSNLERKGREM